MDVYVQAITQAFQLLTSGDQVVWPVISLSLRVSGAAVLVAAAVGIPLGYLLGISRYAGRGILLVFVNTAMGFPPVVVGLFVYIALSRSGPLGPMNLLFTPPGMVIAQVILATPLVIGVSAATIASVPRDLRVQLQGTRCFWGAGGSRRPQRGAQRGNGRRWWRVLAPSSPRWVRSRSSEAASRVKRTS